MVEQVDSTPLIDILIVTFNSAHCLPVAVRAVHDFVGDLMGSLIIVDNASSDRTIDTARVVAPEAVIVRNEENLGFAAAVNRGLAASRAEYVALVNPDVGSIEGHVSDVFRVFDDRRVAAVAGAIYDADGERTRSCHAAPDVFTMLTENLSLAERFPGWARARRYRLLDWDMESERSVDDACGAFLFLRRKALASVGGFDERYFLYWEETDWLTRARAQGWKVVYTPKVKAVHSAGTSSTVSGDALHSHLLESGYRYLRKHRGVGVEWAARALFATLDICRIVRHAFQMGGAPHRVKCREATSRLAIHLGVRRAERPN